MQELSSAASVQMLRDTVRKQRISQPLLLPRDSIPKVLDPPTSLTVPVVTNDSKESLPSIAGQASEPAAEAAQRSGSASTPDRQHDAGQPNFKTSSAMSSVAGDDCSVLKVSAPANVSACMGFKRPKGSRCLQLFPFCSTSISDGQFSHRGRTAC